MRNVFRFCVNSERIECVYFFHGCVKSSVCKSVKVCGKNLSLFFFELKIFNAKQIVDIGRSIAAWKEKFHSWLCRVIQSFLSKFLYDWEYPNDFHFVNKQIALQI